MCDDLLCRLEDFMDRNETNAEEVIELLMAHEYSKHFPFLKIP